MTEDLTAADFPAFLAEVSGDQGVTPFPWQQRLVDELASSEGHDFGRGGQWPRLLDLPTASGKSTTIDIAVFMMALSPAAPRRVVFVVDRRVIVQQAAQRARLIQMRLATASAGEAPVLSKVARRLRERMSALTSDEVDCLHVAELRGAVEVDESWARRPDAPSVIVSTVDQVGSRLLMQGYGVSEGMRPIHAGLLSNDVLFLLDEVHVSQPFAETLAALRFYRARYPWPGRDVWQVCELSATPGRGSLGRDHFRLSSDDLSSPLGGRLKARKPVRLESVRTPADSAQRGKVVGQAAAHEARGLIGPGCAIVGVVLNRVDSAVAAAAELRNLAGADGEVVLLTGRMRPCDRDDSLAILSGRVRSGRRRSPDMPKLWVVGTQSIEVGADFDFDAIVTECASLDALKQRFGRVDRVGDLSQSGVVNTSVVIASSRIAEEDPIYGLAAACTWTWLKMAPRDFGVLHLAEPGPDERAEMSTPARHAPVLLPSHLDRWWQRPRPSASPEVAPYLHGFSDRPLDGDVSIVWRSGLIKSLGIDDEYVKNALVALPPHTREALPLPRSRTVAWLTRSHDHAGFADVERVLEIEADPNAHRGLQIPFVLWRGGEVLLRSAREIRPGDTVIVDVAAGGLTQGTWDPSSSAPVTDRAVEPAVPDALGGNGARGRTVARIDRFVLEPQLRLTPESETALWKQLPIPDPSQHRIDDEALEAVWSFVQAVGEVVPYGAYGDVASIAVLAEMAPGCLTRRTVKVIRGAHRDAYHVSLSEPARLFSGRRGASAAAGLPVELHQHLLDTQRWAEGLGRACGVDSSSIDVVTAAAYWHDVGKLDSRFQAQLRDGLVPEPDVYLAKSGIEAADRGRWESARRAAGYPRGASHAALSALLLDGGESGLDSPDDTLMLHLVASHHGGARPFVPVVERTADGPPAISAVVGSRCLQIDAGAPVSALDSGIPDRFWSVLRERGWFAQVWLESLVRLADHRASEYGSMSEGATGG